MERAGAGGEVEGPVLASNCIKFASFCIKTAYNCNKIKSKLYYGNVIQRMYLAGGVGPAGVCAILHGSRCRRAQGRGQVRMGLQNEEHDQSLNM